MARNMTAPYLPGTPKKGETFVDWIKYTPVETQTHADVMAKVRGSKGEHDAAMALQKASNKRKIGALMAHLTADLESMSDEESEIERPEFSFLGVPEIDTSRSYTEQEKAQMRDFFLKEDQRFIAEKLADEDFDREVKEKFRKVGRQHVLGNKANPFEDDSPLEVEFGYFFEPSANAQTMGKELARALTEQKALDDKVDARLSEKERKLERDAQKRKAHWARKDLSEKEILDLLEGPLEPSYLVHTPHQYQPSHREPGEAEVRRYVQKEKTALGKAPFWEKKGIMTSIFADTEEFRRADALAEAKELAQAQVQAEPVSPSRRSARDRRSSPKKRASETAAIPTACISTTSSSDAWTAGSALTSPGTTPRRRKKSSR